MDLFTNLALGFSVAFTPVNLMYAFAGCFLGTVIGVLPGIGPLATIAMLLYYHDRSNQKMHATLSNQSM